MVKKWEILSHWFKHLILVLKNQSDWKIIKSKIFEFFAQKIVENIVEFSDKKVYKTSV